MKFNDDCPAILEKLLYALGILTEEGNEGIKIARFRAAVNKIHETIIRWELALYKQNN